MGIVTLSDNASAKLITLWPWQPALYILCKVNANSNNLLEKFEPHSSFRFQYRLETMTTFFKIAVFTNGAHSILFWLSLLVTLLYNTILNITGKSDDELLPSPKRMYPSCDLW